MPSRLTPTPIAMAEWVQWPRRIKYRLLSDCRNVSGSPKCWQPVMFMGEGSIRFGEQVQLGWRGSPAYLAGYSYFECRGDRANIEIRDRSNFNNSVTIVSAGAGVQIGEECDIGPFVEIYDADFHDLDPDSRRTGIFDSARVVIGRRVFLGSGVKVLKGAQIGDGAAVGAGSVVSTSIPANTLAAGVPARVLRRLTTR